METSSREVKWSDFLKLEKPPKYIIGSDENGTGALAGPILVTACVFPFEWQGFEGLQDSKKYQKKSEKIARKQIAEQVFRNALVFSQVYIQPAIIDSIGMYRALLNGHRQVIQECQIDYPDSITIVDGNLRIPVVAHISVVRADGLVPAVSAASVLGKVERDWWMETVAEVKYPGYGFSQHSGYSTGDHLRQLNALGPCAIHRKSYAPVKRAMRRDHDSHSK